MSNARIMLLARGEQDSILTENAEYTFFRRDLRTYTQFGTDWIIVNTNTKNASNFIFEGMTLDTQVPINGDVLTEVYIRFKLDAALINEISVWDYSGNTGTFATSTYAMETIMSIFDSIQFIVNNKIVSEIDSIYLLSYFDLYLNQQQKNELVPLISFEYAKKNALSSASTPEFVYLYLPIPFWFHKTPSNAFPVWALKNNNIILKLKLNKYKGNSTRSIRDIDFLYQFGFLSPEEKEKFTNLPLEYTIKQINLIDKFNVNPNGFNKVTIPQTHYLEYLLWNISIYERNSPNSSYIGFRKFTDGLSNATISLNGNQLIDAEQNYFKLVQRYQHFKCDSTMTIYPYQDISSGLGFILYPNEYFRSYVQDLGNKFVPVLPLYTYSFGLDPLENKETGFLSTEKFTHSQLDLRFNSLTEITDNSIQFAECRVYGVRHNILRVQDGNINILFS
jgi:hypothetical protein